MFFHQAIWPHSGHYRPTQENFQDFISFLKENDVDMTNVQIDSDEDKEPIGNHVRTHSSEEDMSEKEPPKNIDDHPLETTNVMKPHTGVQFDGLIKNLSTLEIPNIDNNFVNQKTENQESESCSKNFSFETILDGYEAAEDKFCSQENYAASMHELSDDEDEPCIDETIIQRNNSNRDASSFQLGRQISCKWSTGAGPRIGCLRDYPTELQSQALKQANLSPRSAPSSLRHTNTGICMSPLSFENKSWLRRYKRPYRTQSTPFHIGSVN